MTTISDVVYRANGQPASGTVVITWPSFSTADNKAVAAGELSVAIGAAGLLTVQLAPNEGAAPSGTYYKAVYKLSDGTTSTEYWVVPSASPTTIAAIRATVVPTQVAAQLASKQYVDSVLSNTESVVHKTGTESITGVKTFSVSPTAPDPTTASAVANKGYVDVSVGNVASGYVSKAGDTMTGVLSLLGDPVAPNQAANRHYVDAQYGTLAGGIAQKLGKLNDTPITLAGVRYADQFAGTSVGAKIDSACLDLAGANGSVVIPSTMGGGWSLLGIPSNCNIIDWRGIGGSTQSAYKRGIDYYGRYTTTGAGLQVISPMLVEFDAYAGGVNEYPGGAGTKTQWQGIRIEGFGRTVGERKGVVSTVVTYGKGDSIGVMGESYDLGGFGTGGDEGSEGGRFTSIQGNGSADGGFPRGTVAAVSGNVVTGTWTAGTNAALGEQRPLINTSRNVYSTGNIASASAGTPCTITGTGTGWSAGLGGTGAKSDLFLEIAGNSNGVTKHVVPVISVTDDTHLVIEYNLNELGPTCLGPTMSSSGSYNIFKGGNVASLTAPVSGSLNAAAVNLSAGGGNFQVGDTIQQPLGYNYHGRGVQVLLQKIIGEPQGGGVYVGNAGVQPYRDAFVADGLFQNGIDFYGGPINQHGVVFNNPVTGSLIRQSDITAGTQQVLNILNSSGTQRTLTFDRGNDQWGWSGNQFFSATDQRIGIGTNPQPNIHSYFYWNNAAWSGLILAPNVAPNAGVPIFDTQVAGIPRFRVENTKVRFNNGLDVVGYSDNQVTQKWSVTGASGTAVFNGGMSSAGTIVGSTVNATSGFQVNGTSLGFGNLTGSVSATQMPGLTGDVTTSAGAVATTLATSGVTAGTYTKFTVDAKGRATSGATAAVGDLSDGATVATKSGSQNQSYQYGSDSGAADAYVVTLSPAPGAYAAGQRFSFKATNANAASTPTLNVNGLGAKTITKNGGGALAANDIKAGQIVDVEYDGANLQMQSTLGNASGLSNGYTMQFAHTSDASPASSTNHYAGIKYLATSRAAENQFYVPKACTVKEVQYHFFIDGTRDSAANNVTFRMDLNSGVSTFGSTTMTFQAGSGKAEVSGLSQALAAGDLVAFNVLTPTFSTSPTSVRVWASLYCE
ncbi:MAG: putative autotransporter protein [Acidobacteriales bacterium]|nr:putative autotransporter protein [Terriglobales bacterium]